MSPWASKRLHEFNGDISQLRVVKKYPSILDQVANGIAVRMAVLYLLSGGASDEAVA